MSPHFFFCLTFPSVEWSQEPKGLEQTGVSSSLVQMERIILVNWREGTFLNLLFWLIKELKLHFSCCQTCTVPV